MTWAEAGRGQGPKGDTYSSAGGSRNASFSSLAGFSLWGERVRVGLRELKWETGASWVPPIYFEWNF